MYHTCILHEGKKNICSKRIQVDLNLAWALFFCRINFYRILVVERGKLELVNLTLAKNSKMEVCNASINKFVAKFKSDLKSVECQS